MTTTTGTPAECWCHAEHKLRVPADSADGLCAKCRSRSPSACAKAHGREALAAVRRYDTGEGA